MVALNQTRFYRPTQAAHSFGGVSCRLTFVAQHEWPMDLDYPRLYERRH